MRVLFRYLLAAAGGVLWGLCFGKDPLSLAAWIALAPLVAPPLRRPAPAASAGCTATRRG